MSVSRLPSNRWRAQVYVDGKVISAARILGLTEATFSSKRKAEDAVAAARRELKNRRPHRVTVQEWVETWTTHPMWARRKASTNIVYAQQVRKFARTYGHMALEDVGDQVVAEWLRAGNGYHSMKVLRTMFGDAASAKAGRLIVSNPWEGLRLGPGKGRADEDIPSEQTVWAVIRATYQLANPGFGAWMTVGAFTGLRPGELDALKWSNVDLAGGVIHVVEQFSRHSKTFTRPKNGKKREAVLTPPARLALQKLAPVSRFCFTNLHGNHWRHGSRRHFFEGEHGIRQAAGYEGDFYEAGRHFAGWYMTNVLDLHSELVAHALGHEDGGELVRRLYGHRDKRRSLQTVREAYERQGLLRAVGE